MKLLNEVFEDVKYIVENKEDGANLQLPLYTRLIQLHIYCSPTSFAFLAWNILHQPFFFFLIFEVSALARVWVPRRHTLPRGESTLFHVPPVGSRRGMSRSCRFHFL